MVEQAMFFLAGLLLAGLAGLLAVPAFARRALRLSAARARMLAPLSLKEVAAERDMLRGEHAVARRRLEQRIEALQDGVARHRAELGRQIVMLTELESAATARTAEIADLNAELAARQSAIAGLEAELGASQIALNDFTSRLDRAYAEIALLRDERVALETAADEQRSVIAGLETRASGLEMKLDDAARAAKAKAAAAEAEQARLSLEAAARASEASRLNAELGQAMKQNAVHLADIEKANGELQRTRQRVSELEAALMARSAPADGAAESGQRPAAPGFGAQGDRALREAISRLAADIARLSGAAGDGAPVPAKSKQGEARAPSSQGPDAPDGAGAAPTRQLQPTAER